ncbi:MAG: hypothetical protein C5B44_06185 [Acidobacteria bacterium]|nr:MAG: hypothetical protein C5B44_06185 [Acidobacteriota bacterium]
MTISWKRHFRVIKAAPQAVPNPLDMNRYGGGGSINSNMASYLPLVYAGHPNRIQRYYQFDDMDRDSDINAALDTIADFCTQSEEQTDEPFEIHYNSDPNESETKIIKTMLDRWIKLNSFKSRLWYMFRDCIKNGDAFFLRDPETQEWLWLDHFMVEMVKVDDTMGKKPEEYLVRGLDYNRQAHFGTKKADPNQYRTPYGTSNVGASRVAAVAPASAPAAFSLAGTAVDPRQRHMLGPFAQEVSVIDAQFVVHLSLSIGNDINWPFGASILEPIFKTFKQKELLEDAIIIYRVQRAPERRIFYIDTGTMPPERAKRHIEAIKNDIHQRRIPNRTGTGGCFDLSTRVPLLDGRTLSIAELAVEHGAGKQNWAYSCDPATGEIVPGKITWAGVTRRDAEVMKLTLDNGETIICTPEHKFPIFGRGVIEAKDIAVEVDRLFSRDLDRQHTLLAIEYLPDRMDVGTLTIDGAEEYHDHHTFALEQGVFTKNSILDAAYNPLCISLDTRIYLLDGRILDLRDIIKEFQAGRNNWVYSVDPDTGAITRGPISWAGITREDAEVVEVVLDNGKSFVCTPDHSIPVFGKGFVQAKDLTTKDPLIRFNREEGVCQYITEVIPLKDRMTVGTITVDYEEKWNSFHTFAITANIFLKNSINDDYFFSQSSDGRGSKVETLPGGELTGEIGDLMFFSRKLARGLRIPVSYLNLGEDEGNNSVTFNDGKLGAAMIQEFRFSKFCTRLQSLLAPVYDKEFKRFLQKNGIEIEWSLFELRFAPPQSFTRYRQIELDSQRVQVYSGVSENRRLSERFKFKKYLGLTEDEMMENEKLWSEENAAKLKQKVGSSPAESEGGEGLGAVGIHPGDELPPEMPPEGDMAGSAEAAGGGAPGMPGPAAPPAPAGAPAAGGAGMAGPAM